MLAKAWWLIALFCWTAGLKADPEAVPGAGHKEAADQGGDSGKKDAVRESKEFSFDEQVGRLSHDDYQERRDAQTALLHWGMKDLDGSIQAFYGIYRDNKDPEVRLRCREILKELVLRRQPWGGEGYLGIRMQGDQARNEEGVIQPVVRIMAVGPGTGADRAGLQEGDLVTGVDAIVFDDLLPTQRFAEYIKSKKPGDEIVLHLRRKGEFMDVPAVLRRRSPSMDVQRQWGELSELPDQEKLDEEDFQNWLKKQNASGRDGR